jgi:hypothetical protein
MGTRLNITELREHLIDLYERYLSGEDITEISKRTFKDYRGANRFVSLEMERAIGILEDIGWNIQPKDILKSKAEERLKALKEEEKNSPKEWFREVYKKES